MPLPVPAEVKVSVGSVGAGVKVAVTVLLRLRVKVQVRLVPVQGSLLPAKVWPLQPEKVLLVLGVAVSSMVVPYGALRLQTPPATPQVIPVGVTEVTIPVPSPPQAHCHSFYTKPTKVPAGAP